MPEQRGRKGSTIQGASTKTRSMMTSSIQGDDACGLKPPSFYRHQEFDGCPGHSVHDRRMHVGSLMQVDCSSTLS